MMRISILADFWFWLYAFAAAGWTLRCRQLLQTLHHLPVIEPDKLSQTTQPAAPVTVLVPAKNEEKNIATCLSSLTAQDHENLQIVVINDSSTDKTGEIVRGFPVLCINNSATPEGWTGKNFALYTGVAHAKGDWFLFTDADTRHERRSVSAALTYCNKRGIDFLTLLPRCVAESFMENLLQPLAMGFLGLWFPIQKVNSPSSEMAFANGQYILIRRALYEKLGGHSAVRGAFLEDFALAEKAKAAGAKIECAMGREIYGTRMYDSFDAIWRGWRRIFLHAFRQHPGMLARRGVETILLSFIPFVCYPLLWINAEPSRIVWGLATGLLVFILAATWRAYRIVRAKSFYAVLHPLAAFILALILFDAFHMAALKKKTVWR